MSNNWREILTRIGKCFPTRSFLLLFGLLLAVAGCDDESTSPRVPADMFVVSGDDITAEVGSEVTLTVEVLDESGNALPDASVRWQVIEGRGSLSATSSITGSDGRASVTWTLGTVAGVQIAGASVDGIAPVRFEGYAFPGALVAVQGAPSEVLLEEVGQKVQLSAVGRDEYGNEITDLSFEWESLDPSIAEVSEFGEVEAIGNGETGVVVTSSEFADTVDVIVDYPVLESIEITADGDTIVVDSTLQLVAKGIDEKDRPFPAVQYEWSSSDETTATVDNTGLVTSHAGGTVTISAEYDGVVGEFVLVVYGRIHNSDISSDETWTKRDSPHWVMKNNLYVSSSTGPTLTIEAGAEVRFHSGNKMTIGRSSQPGALVVAGTEEDRVLITSNAESPSAGDWAGIQFARSVTKDTRISHTTIEYCGADSFGACLKVDNGGQIGVDNVSVRESASHGLELSGSSSFSSTSTNLSVENTAGYAIAISANQVGTIPEGGSFSGSADRIWVEGGGLSKTQVWPNLGVPYVLSSRPVSIYGKDAPALTITAGTELHFQSGGGIDIGGLNNAGTLKVLGTESEPVVMTSSSATPSAGSWRGISFSQYATNENLIQHTTLSYCGDADTGACLRIRDATVAVQSLTIENSGNYGAYLTHQGRFADGSSGLTIRESEGYPVRVIPNRVGSLPANGEYSDNELAAIFIDPGNVTTTQIWKNHGVPYVIGSGTVSVYGKAGVGLTLEPGSELRMGSGAKLQIGWSTNPGHLIAQGNEDAQIRITADSKTPQAGYWDRIEFTQYATVDSRLGNLVVEYGTTNLYLRALPGGLLKGLTIREASECGVEFHSNVGTPPDLKDPALTNVFEKNATDICS